MQRSTSRGGRPGSRSGSSVAANGSGRAIRGPFAERTGPVNDPIEREADRVADAVVRPVAAGAAWAAASASAATAASVVVARRESEGAWIRRAPMDDAPPRETAPAESPSEDSTTSVAGDETASESAPPSQPSEAAPAPADTGPTLLVEDDGDAGPGQMRKSDFMSVVRVDVCAAVNAALSGTGRDSQGCPWIDHWLGYYSTRSASHIERALQRYAPEAMTAATADEYVRIIAARVGRSAEVWASTGEITGAPADVPPSPMPGGKAAESQGGMFFKTRPGGPRHADPRSIRDRLGDGQTMPGPVRSRMESAFGTSFGGVRVHIDGTASQLSTQLNARAFTVGRHVAFGAGEFQPGTIVGDALIAHELAHVVQQGHAGSPANVTNLEGSGRYQQLEDDADHAAIGALSALSEGRGRSGGKVMPRLMSGLTLQRCRTESKGPMGPTRLADARANFRKNNRHLGDTKLDKIDAGLTIATRDNINLLITFYDYYSNEDITEGLAQTARELATTSPGSGTKLRVDVLTPGFSNTTLGNTLIHEFVHTRHDTNVAGSRDYQEGEAYGVEHFLANRAGDTARTTAIEGLFARPSSLASPNLVPALIQEFKKSWALMTVLYEVIDTGRSTRSIPSPLTADEAREMVTEFISSKSRSRKLADLITWVLANFSSFGFPI